MSNFINPNYIANYHGWHSNGSGYSIPLCAVHRLHMHAVVFALQRIIIPYDVFSERGYLNQTQFKYCGMKYLIYAKLFSNRAYGAARNQYRGLTRFVERIFTCYKSCYSRNARLQIYESKH